MTLDFSHGSGLLQSRASSVQISHRVIEAIDAGLAKVASAAPRRAYVGASAIGSPCLRQLFYGATEAPATPPAGRMQRIWARGHAAEDRIIAWLRQAGFAVLSHVDGRQLRFQQLDGRFSGGVDGIISDGPVDLPYQVLLEIKCLKNSSWQTVVRDGLQAFSTIYWWQVHTYLAYFDLQHCLYIIENADSMELWVDLIPLDLVSAQAASDRAVQLIRMVETNEVPPRIAFSRDYWLCRHCSFSDHCWRS